MKKVFLSLLLIAVGMSTAWAGTGDGSENNPYTGEWLAKDLIPLLKEGDCLAYNCVIKNGAITVTDDKLNRQIVERWEDWAVGDAIDGSPWDEYSVYCAYNTLAERKNQMFVISTLYSPEYEVIRLTGHYNGIYNYYTDLDGYFHVTSAVDMKKIIVRFPKANVMLDEDIYLSDVEDQAFVSTFSGNIDGDGHTIWAARPEIQHDGGGHYKRSYLATYAEYATFKNINFSDIREHNADWANQAVIVQQAHYCFFEDITFDNISIWGGQSYGGAVCGSAENCTFRNIKVSNSDITIDVACAGAIVGYAEDCVFDGITVYETETTTYGGGRTGGVAGDVARCSFNDIKILSSNPVSSSYYVGGVVGRASGNTTFDNCFVDDKTVIYCKAHGSSIVGGIAGRSIGGYFKNCVNSALVEAVGDYIGGIVGNYFPSENNETLEIVDCLNTGMLYVPNSENYLVYRSEYMEGILPTTTKTYNGQEYTINLLNNNLKPFTSTSKKYVGGIVGCVENATISRCADLGSLYAATNYMAGVAGRLYSHTEISDCFTDFNTYHDACRAIAGGSPEGKTIKNCLTLTNHDIANDPDKNTFANNYTLKSGQNSDFQKTVTMEQLASGEIGHLLGANWQQDLASDKLPAPVGEKGVYLSREIVNTVGTVCVPFELKSDENITYSIFVEGSAEGSDVTLTLDEVETVPAGVPAMFFAKETGKIEFLGTGEGWAYEPVEPEPAEWQMYGNFVPMTFEGEEAEYTYFMLDGMLSNAKKVNASPYHAYFRGPNIRTLVPNYDPENGAHLNVFFEEDDDDPTAIKFVGENLAPAHNGKTYNLQGVEVNENYRGIVIKNGKKVVNQ